METQKKGTNNKSYFSFGIVAIFFAMHMPVSSQAFLL